MREVEKVGSSLIDPLPFVVIWFLGYWIMPSEIVSRSQCTGNVKPVQSFSTNVRSPQPLQGVIQLQPHQSLCNQETLLCKKIVSPYFFGGFYNPWFQSSMGRKCFENCITNECVQVTHNTIKQVFAWHLHCIRYCTRFRDKLKNIGRYVKVAWRVLSIQRFEYHKRWEQIPHWYESTCM